MNGGYCVIPGVQHQIAISTKKDINPA